MPYPYFDSWEDIKDQILIDKLEQDRRRYPQWYREPNRVHKPFWDRKKPSNFTAEANYPTGGAILFKQSDGLPYVGASLYPTVSYLIWKPLTPEQKGVS